MWDFVICIAVVHHLSSHERRVDGIREMLELLQLSPSASESPSDEDGSSRIGTALIYVWALEQKGSRRGWDEGGEQDVMVPWVLKQKGSEDQVFQRYYHLYKKGELEQSISEAGGEVVESGYEKDNWWAIARRKC
jgi:tRNA (uracil-5-)-methyltransferase TRM9